MRKEQIKRRCPLIGRTFGRVIYDGKMVAA